ncbi:MAG TPA: hypothetical protein VGM07_05440 [Stellaceae bacterium]
MRSDFGESKFPERLVARFLLEYYSIWEKYFPGLNKRAHWHVIFLARTSGTAGISSRGLHRTLYGSYGTDIRTCIERVKDCHRDGFVKVFDASNQECAPSAGCLVGPTDVLWECFDAHCRETIEAICAAAGGDAARPRLAVHDETAISEIYRFFGACDQKWRETSEQVVRQRGLTPAYRDDAMDHLVTYQYWAIVMLLWSASPFGTDHGGPTALVVDEIISRMWDRLRLGHLAIKERVANLIRWGFFAEETIKKHKAVSLTPQAGAAISSGLAEIMPLLADLRDRLVPERGTISAHIA